jgi:hypothetical protein
MSGWIGEIGDGGREEGEAGDLVLLPMHQTDAGNTRPVSRRIAHNIVEADRLDVLAFVKQVSASMTMAAMDFDSLGL